MTPWAQMIECGERESEPKIQSPQLHSSSASSTHLQLREMGHWTREGMALVNLVGVAPYVTWRLHSPDPGLRMVPLHLLELIGTNADGGGSWYNNMCHVIYNVNIGAVHPSADVSTVNWVEMVENITISGFYIIIIFTSQALLSLGRVQKVGVGLLLGRSRGPAPTTPPSQRSRPKLFCLRTMVLLLFMTTAVQYCHWC